MRKTRDYEHRYENEGVMGSCHVLVYENGERPVVVATQQAEPQGAHPASVLNAANIIAADLIREGVLKTFHLSRELREESVRKQTLDLIAEAAPFVFVEEYLEPEHKLNFLWFDSYEELGLILNGKVQNQIGNPYRQPASDEEVQALLSAGSFACECDERFRSACEGLPFYGEHEGWRYCVLHFPGFTEKIYPFDDAIRNKIGEGDYNFRGAWFPYSTSVFQGHDFGAVADFSFAILNKDPEPDVPDFPYFSEARFDQDAHFRGMRFCTGANFESVVFEGKADFSEAVFEGPALFTGGVRFDKEVDFSGARFTEEAQFSDARFVGGAEFSGTKFEGDAGFYDAEFRAIGKDPTLDFSKTEFRKEADFSGARFHVDKVVFSHGDGDDAKAGFSGEVSFAGATFGGQNSGVGFTGDAYFSNIEFPQEANFSDASFHGQAHFWSVTFHGDAGFYDTRFFGEAHFNDEARFLADANFMNARFADGGSAGFVQAEFVGLALFDDATLDEASFRFASFGEARFPQATFGSADFRETTFGKEVSFRVSTWSTADFTEATFNEAADFQGNTWSTADFSEAKFLGDADFTDATFEDKANFCEAAFLARARFLGTETARVFAPGTLVDFQNVRVQEPEHLTFHTVLLRPNWFVNADARNFTFTNARWYGLPGGPEGDLEDELEALRVRGVESRHGLLAKTCRDLYANYEEKRDYPVAGEFHYWSMDVLRKEGWRRFGLIRTLYWALSGYGERPRRAFRWLVAVFAAFAILYMLFGPASLRVLPYSDFRQLAEEAGKATVYSLGAMARLRPDPMPEPGLFQFLVTLEGILGPLQAALLALAIRRKVMR
jgi:uncharacterized protein YjbI with pentapeptide repeats